MVQEKYSLASLDEDVDEDRTVGAQYAPLENMLSATHLVVSLLVAQQEKREQQTQHRARNTPGANLCYAIQYGFSMQLRYGRKSTRDIDFITSIKMKGVWEAITSEERIVVPDSRLVEGVLKIFVKTGQPWDACTEQYRIEVDIKQAGFRGSPRNLESNVDQVGPFEFSGLQVHFNVLNIASMMRIKVECCLTREEQRDFDDVKFMARQHHAEVCRAVEGGIVDPDELAEVLEHEKVGIASERDEMKNLMDAYITKS